MSEKSDQEVWRIVVANKGVPGHHVGLWGPPGTGKTYEACSHNMETRVFNVTITEYTEAHELRGGMRPMGDGSWQWQDGLAIAAWRCSHNQPTVLVINELHKAQGDACTFLHAITDDPRAASTFITLPKEDQEVVRPGEFFQVIVTMNEGPEVLDPALADRFAWFNINDVNPEAVAALPPDLQNAARETCNQRDMARRLSLRTWFRYSRLREVMARDDAAYSAFGHARYEEMLSALELSAAPSASTRVLKGPVENPHYDYDFTPWDDWEDHDLVFCSNCDEDGAAASEHSDWMCAPRRWESREERERFGVKYLSGELATAVQKMSIMHRTRGKGISVVETLMEEWEVTC